jgi:hypothetical protein
MNRHERRRIVAVERNSPVLNRKLKIQQQIQKEKKIVRDREASRIKRLK